MIPKIMTLGAIGARPPPGMGMGMEMGMAPEARGILTMIQTKTESEAINCTIYP